MPKSENTSLGSPLAKLTRDGTLAPWIDQTEVPLGHVLTNHAAGKINSLGGTDARQTRASL